LRLVDDQLGANGCIEVILKHAGKDATAAYNEVHPPSLLNDHLAPSKRIGKLDTSTLPPSWLQHQQQSPPAPSSSSPAAASTKPPLETLISSHDFEAVAARTLSKKAWAFFSSAATDLVTAKANRAVFNRVWWRPRVLRSVRDVNTRTRILGCESAVPFFSAPTGMALLAHPEGERAIAAACGRKGVIQCVSWVFWFSVVLFASLLSFPR
jgi:L-lactate dehydrogenase (cytochrome)